MCPENANVFVAEDDTFWQEMITEGIKNGGHQVVSSAKTLEGALKAVDKFSELGVQVATIDGNLDGWNKGSDGF